MRFVAALQSELTKFISTRMWWILAIVMFVYIAAISGGLGALFGALTTGALPSRGGQTPHFGSLAPLIYSFATSVGYVFPVLLGALATTGEFRHQTLTPTFLANPKRGQVLGAKVTTSLGVGAAFGVVALIASMGLGALALSASGVDTALGDSDTWALAGRALIAMALWAAIGVGVGVLVPNQAAVIVIILAFTQFVEPLLRFAGTLSDVSANTAQFLPGAASDALVGSSFFSLSTSGGGASAMLDWWQGGLVLAAYAAVLCVIGYLTTWRRDIT